MKALLRADGTETSLVMHNERLADPLDPYARSVSELSGKRKKTDADHLEIGKREFMGGLYTNGNGPCLPSWNVIRCLQEGGKRHKLGRKVIQGVAPIVEHVDVLYEGPREPEELWREREQFSLRKGVVVSSRRVMRTRPIFSGWALEVPIEVDANVIDLDQLQMIFADAGKYAGLGDMRPGSPSGGVYGRFVGTVMSDEEWLHQADGNIGSVWADNEANIRRILAEDVVRNENHR